MLAHDFGNDGGAYAVTEIAVYDNAELLLWAEISLKNKKIYLSYPKSEVWVGCFSTFRCTMSL